MISFFPDVNVWLALADPSNSHSKRAWSWFRTVPVDARLVVARYIQLGILRLLTNATVMGSRPLSIAEAWDVFDRFLQDRRVEFGPEPRHLDAAFRKATAPLGDRPASKWIGDCFLLAYADSAGSSLVTFDKALLAFARKHGYEAVTPD
jgi:toxin-antitoxin system PIN domain toxin